MPSWWPVSLLAISLFGYGTWRRIQKAMPFPRWSRRSKIFLATAWLFGGGSVLIGLFYGVWANEARLPEALRAVVLTLAGAIFLYSQCLAMALLVSTAETEAALQSSENSPEGIS